MLKEYVAKRLSFLQPQGKRAQTRGKQEQQDQDVVQETPPGGESAELPAELPAPDPAAVDCPEQAEHAAGPEASESSEVSEGPPENGDFPAGLRAYEAGNYEEAWAPLSAAAGQGHPEAQFLCAQMLRKGLVPEGGDRPALAWYKRAAKQGHIGAQVACAGMYELGRGTEMDLKRALFWYEQAAKQSCVEAQLKCGWMYFRGRAETRNPKKARRWLEAAADNGSEEARQILRERF